MEAKHTLGPWQVTMARHEGVTHYRVGSHCETAIAGDPRHYWEKGHTPPTDNYGYFQPDEWMDCAEHMIANAHLIAAAPDMLALLIELVDMEGPQPGTSAWGDKARAVIAKATGSQA